MTNKKSHTIDEQISLLRSRGMIVKNEQEAKRHLRNISYYRLKGYWWDMQDDRVNHSFKSHSYFEDVIDRYNFDRQLRLVLFDAIEIIEIALRTKIIYHMSQVYGGLWYLNDALFEDSALLSEQTKELKIEFNRSGEIFAKDFRNKHPGDDPDVWIIFEVATLGTLSKFYKNLKHQMPQKATIANEMGLNLHNELSSWLEAICYLRNIIAHHSRIWSRNMVRRPMQISNPSKSWLQNSVIEAQNKKPFLVISAMLYLCNAIDPNHGIKEEIFNLFDENPGIPIYKIGFFNDWEKEILWRR